jgi:hypothetical protein
MYIDKPGPQVGEREVEAFETLVGARLPQDFRAFMLSSNGGVPVVERGGRVMIVDFEGELADVRHLLGLREEYSYSLMKAVAVFRERVPAGSIPIGRTSGGDLFLLCLSGARRGEVWFWNHELEVDEGEVAGMQNITPVAASFTAFLERLVSP